MLLKNSLLLLTQWLALAGSPPDPGPPETPAATAQPAPTPKAAPATSQPVARGAKTGGGKTTLALISIPSANAAPASPALTSAKAPTASTAPTPAKAPTTPAAPTSGKAPTTPAAPPSTNGSTTPAAPPPAGQAPATPAAAGAAQAPVSQAALLAAIAAYLQSLAPAAQGTPLSKPATPVSSGPPLAVSPALPLFSPQAPGAFAATGAPPALNPGSLTFPAQALNPSSLTFPARALNPSSLAFTAQALPPSTLPSPGQSVALSGQKPLTQEAVPAGTSPAPAAPPALPAPIQALLTDVLAAAQAPPAPSVPVPPQRLYSMSVQDQEVDEILIALQKRSGISIQTFNIDNNLISVQFSKVPFLKALATICTAANLAYREVDGSYYVGLPMELKVKFPVSGETQLEAIFRCKHLEAQSLATTLSGVVPSSVKVIVGPRFLSPSADPNTDTSGSTDGDQSLRPLTVTDLDFKVHDIIISGPAAEVRNALMLAQGFDRPRRQVMINIRIVEVDDNFNRALGVSWGSPLTMTAMENPTSDPSAITPTVAGIRVGSFSHAPLQVNATLNALETKGKVKTLSNPSILLLDGERSFILSGQKLQYPTYTRTDQAGQSVYGVSTLKVGVYLQVAVQIGINNDVVLTIIPQVTNVTKFTDYNGGQYPTITTQEAQTTVRAYSGEMIVLGGLKSDTESSENDGIPFLKDLPVLGKFFATSTKIKKSVELMIFITPTLETRLDSLEKINITATE